MKVEYLKSTRRNRKLILVYAGWSSTPELYRGIDLEGWDTAVVYDYRDFMLPEGILDGYTTIYLYAWSLGVFAAEQSLERERITKAFAINGSPFAVSDTLGIPRSIFSGTRENLNPVNLKKFRLRMLGGSPQRAEIMERFPEESDIDSLKEELLNIERSIPATRLRWHRAIIGKNDRIFPPEAQRTAWERHWSRPTVTETDSCHYIDISQLIRHTIPDTDKVATRFSSAVDTYDTYATVQKEIAERLIRRLISSMKPEEEGVRKVLEIGQGTGLLTRLYGPIFRPEDITFIDLYPTPKAGVAATETYMVGDAERILEEKGGEPPLDGLDLVVSSSTVQWFLDIRRFFHNADKVLSDEKTLAFSTFGPKNLKELREVTGLGLDYPDADELEEKGRLYFRDITVEEECIEVEFPNAREALLHLRRTGVGGGFHKGGSVQSLISSLERNGAGKPVTFTYHPIYVIATK